MFSRTEGGSYLASKDGLKISYTFPLGASFLIGEVVIPLDGLNCLSLRRII